jgi:hypothetical protein
MIPISPENPIAWGSLGGILLQKLDEFGGRRRVSELDPVKLMASAHKVDVIVHESRSNHAAAVADHPGWVSGEPCYLGAIPYREDPVSGYRHRPGPRSGRVTGPYPAVDHQVRWRDPRRLSLQ